MNSDKIILVSGATGQQGGATARHLLAKGWPVRALTRDASKPSAQALAEKGAEIVEGDFDHRASLNKALEGVYGVFSVQNFWLPGVGVEGEIRQGKALAEAAKAAGVQHFVYTSVGGAERHTGIPHFESKWQIEEHIRALDLPATILRPVAFMDNFNWSRRQILNGVLTSMGLSPHRTSQLIAADDIGAIAALAFERPEAFIGRAIEIAGDELTEGEIAATFARVIGRPVALVQPPPPQGGAFDEEQVKMGRWFEEKGYEADIPAVRALYPQLMTLATWLRRNGWQNAEPGPVSAMGWS